ncbi:MAG: low temperature requirement protein A [Candidatus Thiodiazotropha sp.]
MSETSRSVLVNAIVARSIDESHRAATPLELFYDLIYVVAIASLAAELHHALSAWHHVGHAIWMYLFIFFCIWWPWNSYTWFASGFDTDDAQFRVASFTQMVGVIIIAAGVKPAFVDNDFLIMMIGYVVMRVPYILMWLKVARDDARSRPVAIRYAAGVFLVQAAWALGVLYFQNWNLFIALVLFELLVPYLAERSLDKGLNTRYHCGHIEERLGLLTIIVLGESMLASAYAFETIFAHYSPELLMVVVGSTLVLFSMWWLYFDDRVEAELGSETKAFVWGYGHYFVFLFATAVGALISVNVDVQSNHAEISNHYAVTGLALAIAGYLVSVWAVHDSLLAKSGLEAVELPLLAVAVIAIAVLFETVLLIGLAFVTLNAIRLVRKHRQPTGPIGEGAE